MLTSRERVQRTLNHQEPDLVPLDLGGSVLTGMHVARSTGCARRWAWMSRARRSR